MQKTQKTERHVFEDCANNKNKKNSKVVMNEDESAIA